MKKVVHVIIAILLIGSNLSASGDSQRCESQGGSWEWNGNASQWQCNEAAPAVDDTAVDAAAPAEEEASWLYVCEQDDLKGFADNRYFTVASNDKYPLILADARTIKIDRKKKIITVWTVTLAAEDGKQDLMQAMSQYGDYSDFGYMKELSVIDYRNMRTLGKAISHHSCNGSAINSYNYNDNNWAAIIPDSVQEAITENIMKKYNLK